MLEISQNQLRRVADELEQGNAGRAIAEMDTYLLAFPQPQTRERLESVKAEYALMENYWRQGVDDPQLDDLYQRLLQRVYVIFANVVSFNHLKLSPALARVYSRVRQEQSRWSLSSVRREMEDFVSEVALLSLEPEPRRSERAKTVYKEHQERMNRLFDYVLTSRMWTEGVGTDMEEMLLSPTIDATDQQLLVSAVTLSLLNQFDMAKFRTLVNVYRRSQEQAVRQRALVGWVLALDESVRRVYPEQEQIVLAMLGQQTVCQELTELQMQLVYCLHAEQDNATIQQEIMPDLIKNNTFRVTGDGIEEKEEDPMEDILNPEASEQRMEKLENTFGRMMDMQRQGADIYFGGFSQMKRFPFFYDISNWLVPFYLQHPDISQYVEKMEGNRFMEKMLQRAPFCHSDRYSLVIAFQQVMERLPEKMRQMLQRGEATMGEVEPEELDTPAYIRRAYLMDLYRFFRLYPSRNEFYNPFDTSREELGGCAFFALRMLTDSPLESYKDEMVSMLKRRKMEASAQRLLDSYGQEHRSVQYYIWKELYDKALELDPHNEKALRGSARRDFELEQYEEALETYDELLLLHPEKKSYQLNKAVCLVKMGSYEEALKLLYQLSYERPEDDAVNRILAWTLTCHGRLEQAGKIYQRLTTEETPTEEDWLNYGYCLWFGKNVEEAAQCFRKYLAAWSRDSRVSFFFDHDLLREHGITETQAKLMMSLVLS